VELFQTPLRRVTGEVLIKSTLAMNWDDSPLAGGVSDVTSTFLIVRAIRHLPVALGTFLRCCGVFNTSPLARGICVEFGHSPLGRKVLWSFGTFLHLDESWTILHLPVEFGTFLHPARKLDESPLGR
jgi:hypothetical protein